MIDMSIPNGWQVVAPGVAEKSLEDAFKFESEWYLATGHQGFEKPPAKRRYYYEIRIPGANADLLVMIHEEDGKRWGGCSQVVSDKLKIFGWRLM
ncbi:hypothetical protein HNQ51_001343 [Inhella inkyongensis]|uniref:Uncharacterized protein n=1 Tax=Inhella inkyongensis TaxID=392593 RepID=A0A840S6F1_9BURK|nr:hypothetical protein [Inhella inkyongensis]MBB5204050.1 hypothetical protein [Inhella inkyongensis]